MDLREAIERAERFPECLGDHGSVADAIMDAAKRELWRREENGRPKRASLEELESHIRICYPRAQGPRHMEAADILKALREVVVPNLKRIGELSEEIKYGPGEALSFEALKAIGESP